MDIMLIFTSYVGWFALITVGVSGSPDKDALYHKLFASYTRSIPTLKENTTITVNFGVGLARADIDEETSILTAHIWPRVMWKDYRLEWSPADHGGVNILHIPIDQIWTPDITAYHSVSGPDVKYSSNVVVYPDGTVVYVTSSIIQLDCYQDYQHLYTCPVTFGGYTHDGFIMELALWQDQAYMDVADVRTTSRGWTVVTNKAVLETLFYPCCPEPQPVIKYELTFGKKITK